MEEAANGMSVCGLLYLSVYFIKLETTVCHYFQMEIANGDRGFGDLEGFGGLDTRVLGCF
jgi:hypothetical protein